MKGLLLKDFYMIWKQLKMNFLVSIVFTVLSLFNDNNIVFAILPIMLTGAMPITLLAYDERSRWTEYCGSLPYSGSQIVSAKYLIGLIMQTVFSLAIFIVMIFRNSSFVRFTPGEDFMSVVVMFIIALMFPTICMPFSLKFGTEKGRMIYYVVVAAVAGAVMLVMESTDDIHEVVNSNARLMPLILIGLVVLYVLSWILSITIYNNREAGKV